MNSISFKMKYKDTDFTREYEIENVSEEAILIETVRGKVVAINESLSGGQASSLANLFVADNYDSSEQIGTLENIYEVKIKIVTETEISQTSTLNRELKDEEPEDEESEEVKE